MQVTITTPDGRVEQLELVESLSMAEVKSFVEAMLGVPADKQALVLNGRVLFDDSDSISAAGVRSGDVIFVGNKEDLSHAGNSQGAAAASGSSSSSVAGGPVFWEGMSVDEVISHNKNPAHVVDVLQGNPRILQELNFHNPDLAAHMRKDRETAIRELRTHLMLNATRSTVVKLTSDHKDREMESRLRLNPMDKEANKYFGEKIQEERIQEQYMHMMQHYPESMSKVLMLYIEVEINGVALQAFVDSGAQSSVMSGKCAEKCNIFKDIDKRFAGQVVGVGTGRTLGRVHIANIKIQGNYFPITLTVMDDSQGLGDSNMEMLLGLDMLKRHRCSIDLAEGKLFFEGANGRVSTPFLHEKDLPETKGGTLGFNPNKQPNEDEKNT